MKLGPLLRIALEPFPVRHYVHGKGKTAARISTRFKAEVPAGAKCYKDEKTAKAQLTRRANGH